MTTATTLWNSPLLMYLWINTVMNELPKEYGILPCRDISIKKIKLLKCLYQLELVGGFYSVVYELYFIDYTCTLSKGSHMTFGWFSKGKCIRIEQYSIVHVLQVNIFISRKARHSQLTSGAKWYMFWLSHLVSDLIIYAAPAIVSVVAIAITQAPYISGTPREVNVTFFLNWTVRSILTHKTSQSWAVNLPFKIA